MKKLIFLLLTTLSINASATHLLGGEISWECKSNGKFQFTLVLYRDCGGTSLPTTTQTLSTNAGVTINCNYISSEEIVTSCYTGSSSCSGATAGTGMVEKAIYRSGNIQIIGTPPASGWFFAWSSCCRPPTITNLVNPGSQGYALFAKMNPYTPPGSTTPLNTSTCYDSSPEFLDKPSFSFCSSKDVSTSLKMIDRDLDSVHYSLAPASDGNSYPFYSVSYATGYSSISPMPASTGNTPAAIDSKTGELSFNSSVTGAWVICVKAEQWRTGQLIGENYRDITIHTSTCTPNTGLCGAGNVSEKPSISITALNNTAITPEVVFGDTVSYRITAGLGDSVTFKLSAIDSYPHPNCASQVITFSANGSTLSLDSNYTLDTNAIGIRTATVTSLNTVSSLPNPNDPFSAYSLNDVRFDMVIDSTHINHIKNSGSQNRFDFVFRFTDDECPIPSFNEVHFFVYVDVTTPKLPFHNSCVSLNTAGPSIAWQPNQDTGYSFGYYLINSIDSSGSIVSSDTLFNWSDSVFTDVSGSSIVTSYKLYTSNKYGVHSTNSISFYKVMPAPVLTYAGYDSTSSLMVEWYSIHLFDWYLIKALDSLNTWSIVDSVRYINFYPGNQPYAVNPSLLDVNNTFGVKVDGVDFCGNPSMGNSFSNAGSLLVVNATVSFTEWSIYWNSYNDSVEALYEYDVYVQYGGTGNPFSLLGTTTSNQYTIASDTSSSLCFYIAVREQGSPDVITRSSISCSSQLDMVANSIISDLKIYPNPVTDYLYIEVPLDMLNSNYSIDIVNALGQSIYRNVLNQSLLKVNLSSFTSAGTYTLLVKNSSNYIVGTSPILLN